MIVGMLALLSACGEATEPAAPDPEPGPPATVARKVLLQGGWPELAANNDNATDDMGEFVCSGAESIEPISPLEIIGMGKELARKMGLPGGAASGVSIFAAFQVAYCPDLKFEDAQGNEIVLTQDQIVRMIEGTDGSPF
jgi:hypothetical protein